MYYIPNAKSRSQLLIKWSISKFRLSPITTAFADAVMMFCRLTGHQFIDNLGFTW